MADPEAKTSLFFMHLVENLSPAEQSSPLEI